MTHEVQSSLQKLRKTVPQLNKISDEAAAVVQRVETLLRDKWSIGIEAEAEYGTSLPISYTNEDEDGRSSRRGTTHKMVFKFLVFARIGTAFRIGVKTEEYTLNPETVQAKGIVDSLLSSQTVAWDQCDRGTKLESFAVLPELLANIAEDAESAAGKVEKASATLGKLLTALSAEK
jgi:hypothetical protein